MYAGVQSMSGTRCQIDRASSFSGGTEPAERIRMRRVPLAFAAFLVVFALIAHQLGWVDGALLLRVAVSACFVLLLVAIVRLPWDVMLHARSALARQQGARRRGLVVDEAELTFARRSARRALVLAITLHLSGAVLAYLARPSLGQELGWVLSVGFLGSMLLRPVEAFYRHTTERLHRSAETAEMPPADAISIRAAVESLEAALAAERAGRERDHAAVLERCGTFEAHARDEASAWRRAQTATDLKIDRVLLELERTVERTQANAEVLAGIRAFVRLIRET
jgi:hypothetical protein